MKSVYFAFIHSHISYGFVFYISMSATNINKILIQKENHKNNAKVQIVLVNQGTLYKWVE